MTAPPIGTVAMTVLGLDLMRYLLAAGLAWLLVFVLLRSRLAGRRILGAAPRPGQVRREFTYSMATVLIFAAHGLATYLLAAAGHLRLYPDAARHGWAWWWVSLALVIVGHDAWFYWTHRLLHRRRLFAAVHGVHHTSRHPTPWAAYSFHPLEAWVQAAFLPLWLAFVPTHTAVVGLFLLHMIVRNVIGHCSHELMPRSAVPGGWLGFITPVSHHHYHHARNSGNFGLYFTWWDRLCGTEDTQYRLAGEGSAGMAYSGTSSKR